MKPHIDYYLIIETISIETLGLGPIQQTIRPLHGIAHLIDGIAPAFETHSPAAMGKLLIPGHKVVAAFMAIDSHDNSRAPPEMECWNAGILE